VVGNGPLPNAVPLLPAGAISAEVSTRTAVTLLLTVLALKIAAPATLVVLAIVCVELIVRVTAAEVGTAKVKSM